MSVSFIRGENPLRADKLNTAFGERVLRGGDTMSGLLTLATDPVAALDAATKQYVDARSALMGPPGPQGPPGNLSGSGTLTGPLFFTATGTTANRSIQDRADDWVNVKDFGALIDGTTQDGPAVGATLASLKTNQAIYIPAGNGATNLTWGTAQGTTPATPVLFQVDGTLNAGAPMLRAFNRNNKGDLFETFRDGYKYMSVASAKVDQYGVLRIEYASQVAGGGSGAIATPLRVNAVDNVGAVTSMWGVHVDMDSFSNQTPWPNNVGLSANVHKHGKAWTAGLHLTADDDQNLPSSTGGTLLGMEIGYHTNGVDDAINVDMWGGIGTREGFHLTQTALAGGTFPAEHVAGIHLSGDANSITKSVLSVGLSTRIYQMVDSRGALAPAGYASPVAAVRMKADQIIDFNGGPALNSVAGNYLQYTATGTPRLRYMAGATEALAIGDSGGLSSPSLPIDVRFYGAKLDGITGDGAAFQAATNATPTDGTIIVPRGGYVVTVPPTRASGNVLWKLDGNKFGLSATPVQYAGGLDDVTETFVQGRKAFYKRATNTTSYATVDVGLDFVNTAGASAVSSALHVQANTAVNTGSTFVWGLNSEITSNTNGSNQHLAGAFTIRKLGTAPAFALYAQAFDNTGLASSAGGNNVACEIDLFANRLDDVTNGGRIILDLVYGRSATGFSSAPMSIHRGFVIGAKVADQATAYLDRMIDLTDRFEQSALDTRGAVQGTSANAIWLADGHRIAFDTAGANTLKYDTTTSAMLASGAFGTTGTASFGTGSTAWLTATGGATNATLGVGGTGNLGMVLKTSGTGTTVLHNFQNGNGASLFQITGNATPVNRLLTTATNTGTSVGLTATGSDTNVGAIVTAKGTGIWDFQVPTKVQRINVNSGTTTWTATTPLATTSSLFMSGTQTSASAIAGGANIIYGTFTDTLKADNMNIMNLNMNSNAGAEGQRSGIIVQLYQNAPTIAGTGPWVPLLTIAEGRFNCGGTALTFADAHGGVYGMNPWGRLKAGATFWNAVTGAEVDVSCAEPSGVFRKYGMQIAVTSDDTGHAVAQDSGLTFCNQLGAAGIKDVIEVGNCLGQFPVYSSGDTSILRVNTGSNNASFGMRANRGIDLLEADIPGWQFRGTSFAVHGSNFVSGAVQVGNGVLQPIASGVKLGAPGSVGSGTPTVAAGGTNYTINDIIFAAGGVYRVTNTAANAVTSVAVVRQPFVPGSAPANPVATTTWALTLQGTGCTLNLSWTAGTDVQVGETGGKLGFNGTAAVAKPTGVAVTVAAIHAALTSLGLIAP